MRPILITGVNGFVGSTIALHLLSRGYAVRGTVRNLNQPDSYAFLYQQKSDFRDRLELVEADLLNPSDWLLATRGVEYVLHVATVLEKPASTPPLADGLESLHVLRAARANGVRKVVRTLGCMSMIPADPTQPVSEQCEGMDREPYRSAVAEEREIRRFYARHGEQMAITTIHPSLIFGPRLSPRHRLSLRIIEDYLNGTLEGSLVPELSLPIVDVRDVCQAHVRALFDPKTDGRRYLIAHRRGYALTDFLHMVNRTAGVDLSSQQRLDTANLRQLIAQGNLSAFFLALFQTWPTEFNNRRSLTELGLHYIPQETTIIDTVRSLVHPRCAPRTTTTGEKQ